MHNKLIYYGQSFINDTINKYKNQMSYALLINKLAIWLELPKEAVFSLYNDNELYKLYTEFMEECDIHPEVYIVLVNVFIKSLQKKVESMHFENKFTDLSAIESKVFDDLLEKCKTLGIDRVQKIYRKDFRNFIEHLYNTPKVENRKVGVIHLNDMRITSLYTYLSDDKSNIFTPSEGREGFVQTFDEYKIYWFNNTFPETTVGSRVTVDTSAGPSDGIVVLTDKDFIDGKLQITKNVIDVDTNNEININIYYLNKAQSDLFTTLNGILKRHEISQKDYDIVSDIF